MQWSGDGLRSRLLSVGSWNRRQRGRVPLDMQGEQQAHGRTRTPAVLGALSVALVGVATFGSVVAGVGEWVEGRDLSVVLPWALPALVASVLAVNALMVALRMSRSSAVAVLGAGVVGIALVALVLVNPPIGPPVP